MSYLKMALAALQVTTSAGEAGAQTGGKVHLTLRAKRVGTIRGR